MVGFSLVSQGGSHVLVKFVFADLVEHQVFEVVNGRLQKSDIGGGLPVSVILGSG